MSEATDVLWWGLLPKDVATIFLSFAALISSLTFAIVNFRVQSEKRSDEARKVFDDAIAGIQTARADFEKLRSELGADFDAPEAVPRRSVISTRRNLATARAYQVIRAGRFSPNSVDSLLMAAALIDSGRPGAAVPYYRKAVELAEDLFDRAVARRVLGRAQILAGDYVVGRSAMHEAIDEFLRLSEDHQYDRGKMRNEAAETYRRLIEACDQIGLVEAIREDLPAMKQLAVSVEELTAGACRNLAAKVDARLRSLVSQERKARRSGKAPRMPQA